MGRKTPGITPEINGTWSVDKIWRGRRLRQRGFVSHEEAQGWLIAQLQALRAEVLHGAPRAVSFEAAVTRYLSDHQDKASIETEIHLLKPVLPHIAALPLAAVHDATLAPFVAERLKAGRAHKTVNLSLGVVRRVLNLAAKRWRDEHGRPWLASAPSITLLPLTGHQRPPRPISWTEQRKLLPLLPDHLAKMALLVLNTGARDDVVCSLQWAWEIPVPELGVSVTLADRLPLAATVKLLLAVPTVPVVGPVSVRAVAVPPPKVGSARAAVPVTLVVLPTSAVVPVDRLA